MRGLQDWLATRRSLGRADVESALGRAAAARALVSSPPEAELRARGFRIQEAPLGVPGAVVRGRVDLDRLLVVLDPEGVLDLESRMAAAGVAGQARTLVLAHELFHVLDPGCPVRLAELAAHLFATEMVGLGVFAGGLDGAGGLP